MTGAKAGAMGRLWTRKLILTLIIATERYS
jgi:hypothetical protein